MAIVGSRTYPDLEQVREYVRELSKNDIIVSGGAKGVDATAENEARKFGMEVISVLPFPNGNGRHSRLCADILISHYFDEKVFSWGRLNLVKPGESRQKYLEAIYAADAGDIKPLLEFARS